MKGIKYVGSKELHHDNLYGTGLFWAPDQVHAVADDVATRMLVHDDVYAEAEPPKGEVPAEKPKLTAEQEAEQKAKDEQPPMVDLNAMDKPALMTHAQRYFGQTFKPQMKEETMRTKLAALTAEKMHGV